MSRFIRKFRTASGAVAVQIVTREGRQVVEIDHVGSAHTDAELALLLQSGCDSLKWPHLERSAGADSRERRNGCSRVRRL